MERTIDLLFVVGFLVNVLKGADLILRPHQQKWVQKKFDSFARRLEKARPLDWYTGKEGARKVYAILLSLTAAGIVLINYEAKWIWLIALVGCSIPVIHTIRVIRDQEKFQNWKEEQDNLPSPGFPIERLNKLLRQLYAPLYRWLFSSKDIGDYILRPLCIVVIGIFWIGVAFVYVGLGMYVMESLNSFVPASGWKRIVPGLAVFLVLIIGGLLLFLLGFGQLMLAGFSLFIFLVTLLMLLTELASAKPGMLSAICLRSLVLGS